MNIAFFLTPKSEILHLYRDSSISQAVEALRNDRHTAVPVLNTDGTYYAVLSEGDLLWALTDSGHTKDLDLDKLKVEDIPRYRDYKPVRISAAVESLYDAAYTQSFVPVIDDNGIFIGIIRRRDIFRKLVENEKKAKAQEQEQAQSLQTDDEDA